MAKPSQGIRAFEGPEGRQSANGATGGALVINADDWGMDCATTDRIFECYQHETISSASAMVFMEDSERASEIALEHSLDAGLHLNLTSCFTGPSTPRLLIEHQEHISRFLRKNRLAPALFHPGLTKSFEYCVSAQLVEFARLYGRRPGHIDGHHHMHLCANVVFAKLLPFGIPVRRNFTFFQSEKGFWNRTYRRLQDAYVRRCNPMPDYLFELSSSLRAGTLQSICRMARHFVVEIEAHPARPTEHKLLVDGGILSLIGDCSIAPRFMAAVDGTKRVNLHLS